MAVPDNIKPIGVFDDFIHLMVVGESGFGKTVFSGTAPNALFLTTDPEGTISAAAFGSAAKEWRINSWSELNDAFRYLRDGGIDELGLEWLIIDNISEAQNLGMKETMELARKNNPRLDEFISSQQDYQRSQNMIRECVKRFHDLPVNIIWTAWTNTENEDSEGNRYYSPGIHGQKGMLAQTVAGYMNIVGYGEVITKEDGATVRRLWFSHSGPYRGKDRFVALGDRRDNLDVPRLAAIIAKAKRERTKSSSARPARIPTKKAAPRRVAATRKAV